MQHILDVMKKMNGVDDDGYETVSESEAVTMVKKCIDEFAKVHPYLTSKSITRAMAEDIVATLKGVKVK